MFYIVKNILYSYSPQTIILLKNLRLPLMLNNYFMSRYSSHYFLIMASLHCLHNQSSSHLLNLHFVTIPLGKPFNVCLVYSTLSLIFTLGSSCLVAKMKCGIMQPGIQSPECPPKSHQYQYIFPRRFLYIKWCRSNQLQNVNVFKYYRVD